MEDTKPTVEGKQPKLKIAHMNVRHGLHDYHDGSSLNHNLGNDDYLDGCNLPDEMDVLVFDGVFALGNLTEQEDDDVS